MSPFIFWSSPRHDHQPDSAIRGVRKPGASNSLHDVDQNNNEEPARGLERRRLIAWLLAAAGGSAAAWWVDDALWRLLAALGVVVILGIPEVARRSSTALRRLRPQLLLLLAIASVAQATAPELWSFSSSPWVRVWNVYHYFLGSKYFPELGYHDLYVATLAADEAGNGYWGSIRTLRDLETYELISRSDALQRYHPEEHFSAERWQSFRRDVEALQGQRAPSEWRNIFRDRGYNPPPLWTAVGRTLTWFPADWTWALKLLCSLDLLLLAFTFRLVYRTFGTSTLAGALLLWSLSPVNDGRIIGGFLQYDWFCALAAGLCYLHRQRPLPAAVFFAYAAGTRVFPAILLLSAAVPWVRRFILEGRLRRRDLHFAAALGIFGLLAFGIATLGGGGGASWRSFVANIDHHNEAHGFGHQRIGWAHAFTRDIRSLDFTPPNRDDRRDLFTRQKNLYLASGALLLGLWAAATWRRNVPDALLLGLAPMFVLTVSSRYYWSCLALLPLLARPGPAGLRRLRWLTGVQAMLLAGLAAGELRGLSGFSLYSLFDLLLAAFLGIVLLTYLVFDLRVWRRRHPLAAWYRSRTSAVLFFVCLFLLLCWLRAPDPQAPIRDVDEAVSALIADSWLTGGVPYRDAIDQRGPVAYAFYAVVFFFAGTLDMAAVHWALLLLILVACGVTFHLGRRLRPGPMGYATGYLAAFLLAVCTFTYRRSQMLAFHTEWPLLLFNALAMLLLWNALRRGATRPAARQPLVLAGVCFALGFLSKQPGIFDAGAGALFVLLWQYRRGALIHRATLHIAALLALGFFATLGLTGAYFAWHGAFGDFIFYYWTYNVEHYTAVIPVADRLAALDPFAHRRHYLTANPLLLVGSVVSIVLAIYDSLRRRRTDGRLLVVLWLVAGYFGASYSGRNFGHYFIQIIVPACLATALVLVDLWRWLAPGTRRFHRLGDLAMAARGGVVVAVLIGLVLPVVRFGDEIAWRNIWRQRPVDESRQLLLDTIRRHTTADESIFVWGYYPELYVLAPRRPASRYSNTNYLTGMLPWENHQSGIDTSEHIVEGAWHLLIEELETTRPALVIDTSPGNHRYYAKYPIDDYPPLHQFLSQGYQPSTTVKDHKGRDLAVFWTRTTGPT